jgi:glucuronate isomerase
MEAIMLTDPAAQQLFDALCRIPLIDPHSHIDPRRPTARSLDDILGYHYYTELAHSAGMSKELLADNADPRERVRAILAHMQRFDNTVQFGWFLEIARSFLGFEGERLTAADCDWLCDTADRVFGQHDWEAQVLRASNVEKVFLTNDFDDPLEGFDTSRYVPCLRTDELVFHLDKPGVRQRLLAATGVEIGDVASLRRALRHLFERFASKGAKACAISLPPRFCPYTESARLFERYLTNRFIETPDHNVRARGVFWSLAELCHDFNLPFDLRIGVNRQVYQNGVFHGQDLFDARTSLFQYRKLLNAFPEVTFCVSVLSSAQNQELASYSWIFPNVVTSGHWWYSNIPALIEQDVRLRLQAVPKTKQLGYYSDAYKLEFALPKFNLYRRILAKVLLEDFIRPGIYSESQALDMARLLLRDNARRIFHV